jgi:steroid delta-isomerase-like uncharacterized protein
MAVATPPVEAGNEELARWAFDAVDRQDVDALRQIWTDETVERFPDRTCVGTEEIVSYFQETFGAVADFHMEVIGIAAQDEDVFVQWHMTGIHEGPLLGIQPTGKPLAIDGMDHFVIRDGKVVSNFVIVDQLQYARQIGMMPADGSTPGRAMKALFNAKTTLAKRLGR